jgi:hypothetical protein
MMHDKIGVLALLFLIGLAAFFAYLALTKPDCRTGFVPLLGYGEGWICVSGYKP